VDLAPGLPLVDADYTLVDQVITNLLENATRHTPPQGKVRIAGRVVGDRVEVAVEDEGPGVPGVERDAIFEPFRTGSTPQPSTGVGLAICRAIVEAHGGTITVGDASSGGARFAFTLPVHRPSRAGPPELTTATTRPAVAG
jgi:two-component system sensor histidine kinase KdpD